MRHFAGRTRWIVVGGALSALLASAAVAIGAVTSGGGTVQIGIQVTRHLASTTGSNTFVALPFATRTFTMTRDALATFSGESRCSGPTGGRRLVTDPGFSSTSL